MTCLRPRPPAADVASHPMSSVRLTAVAAATLAAACALAAPPRAGAATCGEGTYAYAGMGSRAIASGVAATIAPVAAPSVRDGHVDGWVGVGGPGLGPHGTDEWIQVGLTSVPSAPASRIYYEIQRPGQKVQFRELRSVGVGEPHRFAVREVDGRASWWRVWLDGSPATAAVYLPGSHAKWRADAVGESWAGRTSGTCNAYAYAFHDVALAGPGASAWSPFLASQHFQDRNYQLVRRSSSSFLARSVITPARAAATTHP